MKSKEIEIKEKETETAKQPPKFSLEKLRENCLKLFGVTQSTFDGASHGLSGEYTVSEMKKIIAAWQNKEVK